ncbi:MAG: 23S rRNA pseudouridine(2605) synthase RluB [Gammaproteobacteria bacterium]|nr:23S rRNA pseudouridine(2605) synthase RluB [Gammaproteobacteria bacterium]
MTEERVQKVLSRLGFGSRREIERWIEQGRVKINGETCTLGDRAKPGDWLHVDGRRIIVREDKPEKTRVIMYHKPEGQVCTRSDPEGRATVFDHLPKAGRARWVGIGRLDINTSGLLLFTTNGELANRLMHPSNEVEREYAVRVNGTVTTEMLRQLASGVALEDGPAHFDDIVDGGGEGYNHWYYVVIREGRNREVRRLWEAVGVRVSRLIRVRYGNIILPKSLHKGRSKELDAEAISELAGSVGLELETATATKKQAVRGTKKVHARTDRKKTVKKHAAKKSAYRNSAAGTKTTGKKTGARTTVKKTAFRKSAKKKPADWKTTGSRTTVKKSTTRKTATKKRSAKQSAVKKITDRNR